MIDKLVQEFKEHEVILERGLKFSIAYRRPIKVPFLPVLGTRKAVKEITIHQPTLATLSAVGREFILFDIQELLDTNKPFTDGVIMADKTSEKMARVIAIMATGIGDPCIVNREHEEKATNELANIIFYNVTPVLLLKLAQAVRMLCNIENFTASTTLMSEMKKGLPTVVEKEG